MTYLPKVWIPVFEKSATVVYFNLLFIMWIVLGILAVWLYSAIRPRYGAGVKTAVLAGVFIWILRELFPGIQSWAFGLYPANTFLLDVLTNLVSCVVGTIIGAWVYKEHP